jgi:2-methylcitrate dehydratase PrpD
MSTTDRAVHPTAELIAFAANAWAFRDAVRAPARAFVLVTLLGAMADARAPRVEIAAAADAPGAARMRAHAIGRAAVTTPLRAAFLTGLAAGETATLATPAVCAALALGESLDAPGATVLDAIIAGTEIAVRVQRALGPGHRERGWDTRGTCGRLGAAVAAGRVLGLQRDAMRDASGIAATAASGLTEARGTMTAPYIVAAAAADGIEAALLARAEFTGAPLALEGRRGLAALMSPSFDAGLLVAGLGETFVMESYAAGPTDAPSGPAYDAVRALVARIERLPSIREIIEATLPTP